MNLSEINWDINASGSWPVPVKAAAVVLVCVLVAAAGIYWDTFTQLDELASLEKQEVDLKATLKPNKRKPLTYKITAISLPK